MELFMETAEHTGGLIGPGESSEALLDQRIDGAGRTEGEIEAIGFARDLLKEWFIEAGEDGVTLWIFDVLGRTRIIDMLEERAFGRTDADGKNSHAREGSFAGCSKSAAVVIFAVGEEDESLVVSDAVLQSVSSDANGMGEGGAALGHDFRAKGLDVLSEGLVVTGQWALQVGSAGEGDQGESIAMTEPGEVEGGEFGAGEAGGGDVGGEHAAGSVDGDDEVEAALADLMPFIAPLGPGKGKHGAEGSEAEKREPKFLARL